MESPASTQSAVTRCGRFVSYAAITRETPTYSFPSAAGQLPFPIHPHMLRHACGFKLANDGHDTRALHHYLGHKNIQHTVRYTDMAPDRFKDFWNPSDHFTMPSWALQAPASSGRLLPPPQSPSPPRRPAL